MSASNPLTTIPTKRSSDATWIGWYDSLPFSKNDNNQLFMRTWEKRGSDAARTDVLRAHMKENGLNLTAQGLFEKLADYKYATLDFVGDVFKVSGYTTVIVGGGLIIFTGAILWRLLTPESTGVIIGTAAKAYTGKP